MYTLTIRVLFILLRRAYKYIVDIIRYYHRVSGVWRFARKFITTAIIIADTCVSRRIVVVIVYRAAFCRLRQIYIPKSEDSGI